MSATAEVSRITQARLTDMIKSTIHDCDGPNDEFAAFMAMIEEAVEPPIEARLVDEPVTVVEFEPIQESYGVKAVSTRRARRIIADLPAIAQVAPACVSTQKPVRYTILVAVSLNMPTKTHGISFVVKAGNHPKRSGPVVHRFNEAHLEVKSADIQAFAILRALEIANQHGWRNVRVKSDYPHRDQLKRQYRDGTGQDIDGIRGAILRLAASFDAVEFRHVARRKNLEARKLARAAAGNVTKPKKPQDESLALWEIGIEREIAATGERDEYDDEGLENNETAEHGLDAIPI